MLSPTKPAVLELTIATTGEALMCEGAALPQFHARLLARKPVQPIDYFGVAIVTMALLLGEPRHWAAGTIAWLTDAD
jgi:hypothetical protein